MMTEQTTNTKVQPQQHKLAATTAAPAEQIAEAMLPEQGGAGGPSQAMTEAPVAPASKAAASACCGVQKQQSCCAPSAKASCCGAQPASTSCGCQ